MVKNSLNRLWRLYKDRRIARLPSRRYLLTTVIPEFAAGDRRRMLFVGTRSYNRPAYAACTAAGIAVWSIDLDPAAAAQAAPNGHIVGDIREVDRLAGNLAFDTIMFNGVLGWGIDCAGDALGALEAMAKVAPRGLLFIGWNPGLTDGSEIAAMRPLLKRASLGAIPEVIEFPACGAAQRYPHRYELFTFA